jgi:hypothetical protein
MVDGHVYAQPLYLPGISIGGATHNVLFVATEHDTVFAYDADDASAGTPLWMKSLGAPMRTFPGTENQPVVSPYTVSCRDMYPETGVTSTPVIDPATGRLYVVSKNFENNVYHQRLHALDVLTGNEVSGSPVEIAGSVPGTGVGGNGTTVSFDPQHHLNRPGLLLFGGNVYIAFASHCDDDPYHGWVFAYSAAALTQTGIYATQRRTSMKARPTPGWAASGSQAWGWWPTAAHHFAAGNGAFSTTNKGASSDQPGPTAADVHRLR